MLGGILPLAGYRQGTIRFITLTPHKKFRRIRDIKVTNISSIFKSVFPLEIYALGPISSNDLMRP